LDYLLKTVDTEEISKKYEGAQRVPQEEDLRGVEEGYE
jgi:hypothetical protein